MKTKKTILILAATLAAATGAYAQNSNAAGSRGPGPRPSDAELQALRAECDRIVAIYDENGDGKLDSVEREVLLEDIQSGAITPPDAGHALGAQGRRGHRGPPPELVVAYDLDGDGVLNADERSALHADIEAGVIPPPQEPRGKRGGRHGPPQEILDQFDLDGDGVLNAEEHAAVRAAIEAGEIELPAPPAGRSGRGR